MSQLAAMFVFEENRYVHKKIPLVVLTINFGLYLVVLQFCNFYGSIFYIAFFKGSFAGYPPEYMKIAGYRLDECGAGGCLIELTIQLAVIMVGKQAINNFMEVVLPRIKVSSAHSTVGIVFMWHPCSLLLTISGLQHSAVVRLIHAAGA